MELIDKKDNAVLRAVIRDELDFLGAELIVSDERGAIVKLGGTYTCAFDSAENFTEYAKKYGVSGEVCVMGAPRGFTEETGAESNVHKTFAYLESLPPAFDRSACIRRLAPSLAGLLSQSYHNGYGGYGEDKMRAILKRGSVFGLFEDSKLAGFIGEHEEGGMGMLTVFEPFRRRGHAVTLEKFLIGYIMSFGLVPTCDVDITNSASLALQEKLGLVAAPGYTYWIMDYQSGK